MIILAIRVIMSSFILNKKSLLTKMSYKHLNSKTFKLPKEILIM